MQVLIDLLQVVNMTGAASSPSQDKGDWVCQPGGWEEQEKEARLGGQWVPRHPGDRCLGEATKLAGRLAKPS